MLPRGLIFFTGLMSLLALLLSWQVNTMRETIEIQQETIDLKQETIDIHQNNSEMCLRALRTTSDFLAEQRKR